MCVVFPSCLLTSAAALSFNYEKVSTNHKYIPIKYWGRTWEENVRGLQDWVLRRLKWMDEWVARL